MSGSESVVPGCKIVADHDGVRTVVGVSTPSPRDDKVSLWLSATDDRLAIGAGLTCSQARDVAAALFGAADLIERNVFKDRYVNDVAKLFRGMGRRSDRAVWYAMQGKRIGPELPEWLSDCCNAKTYIKQADYYGGGLSCIKCGRAMSVDWEKRKSEEWKAIQDAWDLANPEMAEMNRKDFE